MNDNVWIEKYRPQNFDEIVGQDEIIEAIKGRLYNLPHMIFEGRAGTGKTSTAKVIAKTLQSDFMELNSSSERGIDTVRIRILSFCKHLGLNNNVKILFLDESDSMTNDAMLCLRPIMEKYAHNVRFIFGCNDLTKIILPIQSRCKIYRFKPVSMDAIIKRLQYIAEKENIYISISEHDYKAIAEHSHGDFRKSINDLQMGEKYTETSEIFNTL